MLRLGVGSVQLANIGGHAPPSEGLMRTAGIALVVLILIATCPEASADRLKISRGLYRDSDGLSRERLGADAQFERSQGYGGLTGQSYQLGFFQDRFFQDDLSDDDYTREIYGSKQRVQGTLNAAATQVWRKATETRLGTSYTSDGKLTTRSFGAGVSHWLPGESWRFGLDLSRSLITQPFYQTLDYDSELVGRPPNDSATVGSLSLRRLATPTTILDTTLSYTDLESRPPTRMATIQLRQFVGLLKGSLHAVVTRAYNRGSIGRQTDYGQVDAWTQEIAWLQHLWRGALARLGYRYYREDETTRAYQDERVFGSDTIAFGLAQDIERSQDFCPMVVEAVAARYETNTSLAATTFELALTAKF